MHRFKNSQPIKKIINTPTNPVISSMKYQVSSAVKRKSGTINTIATSKKKQLAINYPNTKNSAYSLSIPFFSVMLIVHIGAIMSVFYFTKSALFITLALIFFTHCIGISIGMHRLFSHRSFQVAKPVSYFIALCSTLAFQGTIAQWVAHHRMHHAQSDTAHDPHNINQGFFYAHIGWLLFARAYFAQRNIIKIYARDIYNNPVLRFFSNKWFMVATQLILIAILYAIGGLGLVLWGVCLRLCVCYHATWLVNSAAHSWGYKNYPSDDLAKNNWWVALLTWGEGWHNNHHVYAQSVKMGHRWFEIDISYYIIKLLSLLKITKKLKYYKK